MVIVIAMHRHLDPIGTRNKTVLVTITKPGRTFVPVANLRVRTIPVEVLVLTKSPNGAPRLRGHEWRWWRGRDHGGQWSVFSLFDIGLMRYKI